MRLVRARVVITVITMAVAAVMGTSPPAGADTRTPADTPEPAGASRPDEVPAAFEAAALDPPAASDAQADGMVVTLEPATGIEPNQEVEVTVTGITISGLFGVFQCPSTMLDDLEGSNIFGECTILALTHWADPFVSNMRLHELVNVRGVPPTHCGRAPGNCAVVAWSPYSGQRSGVAFDMGLTPLAMTLSSQEVGYAVTGLVTVPPGSAAQLAQCVRPVGATVAASTCSPPQPVSLDAQGYGNVSFDLLGEVSGPAGTVPCPATACALTVFDGDGTTLDSATVEVLEDDGPPQLTLERSEELPDNWRVETTIRGVRNESFVIAQCHSSVEATDDITGGPCGPTHRIEGTPYSSGAGYDFRVHKTFEGADGATYHCDQVPGDCVVAIASDQGNFDAVPIGFTRLDEVTLSPASGLLPGDEITVNALGLAPGATYHVLTCAGAERAERYPRFNAGPCETMSDAGPAVVASPTGTLSTTAIARDRFTDVYGSPVYCRAQCQVAVVYTGGTWDDKGAVAAYELAVGELDATPSTGLADGQEVTVDGTDLMPSYEGPSWWVLTTGTWALGQCGAEVLDDPTVAGVFRYCSIPPGGGVVDVPGSTFERSIDVAAGLDPPAGDPLDCTASSNACVVALTRIEQDGTVSLHTTPLAFAP